MLTLSLQQIAKALGGEVSGDQVRAPGPGHSSRDRSLSIKLDPSAPNGFVVNSFAGDDPIACKDYVRSKAGIEPFKANGKRRRASATDISAIIAAAVQSVETEPPQGRIVATYDYTDDKGALLYQVCRLEPKSFRQRRPDGKGGWIWSVGERRVLYRLPELLQYPDATVFVCEGEKDADRVASLGHCATTVACGKWTDECVKALAGRDCVILEDNDEAGRKKALEAAQALHGQAKSVRIVRLPDLPEKGDVSDWLDADQRNAGKLVDVCFDAPLWTPDFARQHATEDELRIIEPGWSTPVDLWAKFDAPELPANVLPAIIERFAREQGSLMGADPAGLAMAALTVCAAALPDRVRLRVKVHDHLWTEQARLWTALIGMPSTKKSPILRQAVRPLARLDAQLFKSYMDEKAKYDALSSEERKTAVPPKQVRLRMEDTTIEGAQEVLRDSPDGVLCLHDELSGWFGSMDKYAAGRGAAKDRGFWLQAFNGGQYAVNRISRGSFLIRNLSASVLGGIQPDPLRKIVDDAVDDGLIQRLCPIMLRPGTVGRDDEPSQTIAEYEQLVERLRGLGRPVGDTSAPPIPLCFSEGAQAIRRALEQRHLDLMSCEAINRKLAAHIGKYDSIFPRLCLLWHAIEHSEHGLLDDISEDTARRVERFLHGFLLPHATAFYAGTLGLSDDHERLTAVAGYILAHKLDHITNRDIQRGDRTMRRLGRQDIAAVCDQLDALGWLNRTPGLRPTDAPRWDVNPVCHAMFEKRATTEAERRRRDREMISTMLKGAAAE